MTIRLGSTTPEALYIGTTPVYKVYLGSTLLLDVSYLATQNSQAITTQNGTELTTQASTTY